MNTMIERVARAIAEALTSAVDRGLSAEEVERETARAAITAMRAVIVNEIHEPYAWRVLALIDAALA